MIANNSLTQSKFLLNGPPGTSYSETWNMKYNNFFKRDCIWKCCLSNCQPFGQIYMCNTKLSKLTFLVLEVVETSTIGCLLQKPFYYKGCKSHKSPIGDVFAKEMEPEQLDMNFANSLLRISAINRWPQGQGYNFLLHGEIHYIK